MKGFVKVMMLVLLTVAVACNKENKTEKAARPQTQEVVATAAHPRAVFATQWQTVGAWKKDGQGYHARQRLPIKPKDGKVLLFARNVWAADAPLEEPMEDIALQLPFDFLPYTDKPGVSETWAYEVVEDELKIDLKVEGGELQPRPVQVRCLYIPDSVWTTLSTAGETDLAYESLVDKLKIKP